MARLARLRGKPGHQFDFVCYVQTSRLPQELFVCLEVVVTRGIQILGFFDAKSHFKVHNALFCFFVHRCPCFLALVMLPR